MASYGLGDPLRPRQASSRPIKQLCSGEPSAAQSNWQDCCHQHLLQRSISALYQETPPSLSICSPTDITPTSLWITSSTDIRLWSQLMHSSAHIALSSLYRCSSFFDFVCSFPSVSRSACLPVHRFISPLPLSATLKAHTYTQTRTQTHTHTHTPFYSTIPGIWSLTWLNINEPWFRQSTQLSVY